MQTPLIFIVGLVSAIGSTVADGGTLSEKELLEGLQEGQKYVEDLERLEAQLLEYQRGIPKDVMDGQIYSRFKHHSPSAVAQSKKATVEMMGRQYLSEKYGIPVDQINFDSVSDRAMDERASVSCNPSFPFRSYDGTCNNLANPLFGKSSTIFGRLMSAFYQDGIGVPRSGPSPRLISTTVLANESLPHYANTLMVMQWGQFLDHDLILTPTASLNDGSFINCCSKPQFGSLVSPPVHPECMPITIPTSDPVYGPSNNCMSLVRSTVGSNLDGTTPFSRQQINDNTHWIDGSQVYGSTESLALSLRDRTSGKGLLKTSSQNGRPLMPLQSTCCPSTNPNCPAAASCFVGGDVRVNEQPLLTMMHTLWVREHNRVANSLFKMFGNQFDDEFYYQQARRIVIAELQHITYTEYLPVMTGQKYQKTPPPVFRPNPAVYNEFAAAAFRMGHSQLKSFVRLLGPSGGVTNESYFLADSFLSGARMLSPTYMDSSIRGLLATPVQKVDNCFADDVRGQLFRLPGSQLGFDLTSLNVQRGRDHGLQPYANYWRNPSFNGLNTNLPSSFDSLEATTSKEVISYLKQVYPSVADIDLYVGGVTETPLPGALLGPTFASIFTKQFDNLRQADRFFYDDLSSLGAFTPEQLKEIQKVSLARVICDNSDGSIREIQPRAFFAPEGPLNSPVPCDTIPGIVFPNLIPR